MEFLEIASVALLPRNDAGNSRIPYRDPRFKPEDDIGFEIPRSSWGMTQGLGNSRIFVIASEAKQSLGILNSSLGILDLFLGILDFA